MSRELRFVVCGSAAWKAGHSIFHGNLVMPLIPLCAHRYGPAHAISPASIDALTGITETSKRGVGEGKGGRDRGKGRGSNMKA